MMLPRKLDRWITYRATLQPQVDKGILSPESADMLADDYAETEKEWEKAKTILNKLGWEIE